MRFASTVITLAVLGLVCSAPVAYAKDAHKDHDHKHEHHSNSTTKADEHADDSHDHGHHEAPHGGTLVVLGDEHAAHLELVLDPAKGQLTGYVLDGEAEKAIRITQPEIKAAVSGGDVASSASITLKPVESPLTGEKAGNTSQFEGNSDALKGKKKFDIVIEEITVKGQSYKMTKSPFPGGNH